MNKFFTPIKVGLLTLVGIVGLIYMLRTVEKGMLTGGKDFRVYALLENVLGVSVRSRVVMAGIEVGFIESVELSILPFKDHKIFFSGSLLSIALEKAKERVIRLGGRVSDTITKDTTLIVVGIGSEQDLEEVDIQGVRTVSEDTFHVMCKGRAKVNMRIRRGVPLYRDASLAKISESLLGDKLIDLSPGTQLSFPIGDGDQILKIYEETDINEVFRKMDLITGDIRSITKSLRKTVGEYDREDSLGGVIRRMTQIAANVTELTERVNATFQRGSVKVEQILDDVAGVTAGTRSRYEEILDNVRDVTIEAKRLVANVNDIVGRGEQDWKEGFVGVKDSLEKAGRTLERLENITRKIDEGQGTLGRLVNDDEVLDKTEGILDDAASITRRLAKLQLIVDMRSEFHFDQNAAKNYLAVKLMPKPDKYYMIEVINDPRGSVEVVDKEICPQNGSGGCEKRTEITVKDEFKFSLQFAKRIYWLGLRFGIIEGTGGVGMNWYFLNDDLEFRFDMFQFGKNEYGQQANPRLKAMLMYRPTWLADHIYMAAGGDDFFNQNSFDYFFGAGIYFTDQDLKAIFTATGTPNM